MLIGFPIFYYLLLEFNFWHYRWIQAIGRILSYMAAGMGVLLGWWAIKLAATADIFALNPFQEGDEVSFIHPYYGVGITGYIREVGWRGIHIETETQDMVTIASEQVIDRNIVNHSSSPWIYHVVNVPMKPDEDLEKWGNLVNDASNWLKLKSGDYKPPEIGNYIMSPGDFNLEDREWFEEAYSFDNDLWGKKSEEFNKNFEQDWEKAKRPVIMYKLIGGKLHMIVSAPVRSNQIGKQFESVLLVYLNKEGLTYG